MTAPLFTICFVSHTLLHRQQRPHLLDRKTFVLAHRKSTSAWRQRHRRGARRVSSASLSSKLNNNNAAKKRRRSWPLTSHPDFVQHVAQSFTLSNLVPPTSLSVGKPGHQHRLKQFRQTRVLRAIIDKHNIMEEPTPQRPSYSGGHSRSLSGAKRHITRLSRSETMQPSPPATVDEFFDSPPQSFGSRSTRSLSSTSRNSNRLSLTLPIALPTQEPSRPTPICTSVPSLPPTPGATPNVRSPTDANDFIHAIAAQERRVLELREDLKNAEAELSRLKKQWGAFDSVRKRNSMVNGEPLRPSISLQNSPNVEDVEGKRRSVELDRRRTMLMSQRINTEVSSPGSGRPRRVIRGGHTRALSLLSPTKPDGGFPILEDALSGHALPIKDSEPHFQNLTRQPLAANGVSKRATWTPRSSSTSPSNAGMKQMAEDFKSGLWTFVEDLRQVAVGDEPITGSGPGRRVSSRQSESDRDTIRASATSSRPHVANAFSHDQTPTPASRFSDPLRESDNNSNSTANKDRPKRTNSKRTKHFSWTPLTVDSFDDSDWSNWDSPSQSAASPRWSGTTVNGDIITTAIPEGKGDENDLPAL